MTAQHLEIDDTHDSDSVFSQTMSWYLDDAVGDDASTIRESDTNESTRPGSTEEDVLPEEPADDEAAQFLRITDGDVSDEEICEQPRKVKVVDAIRRTEECDFKTHGKQKERFIEASIRRKMKVEERQKRWKQSHAAVNYMAMQLDTLTKNTTLRRVIKDDHWPGHHDHRFRVSRQPTST